MQALHRRPLFAGLLLGSCLTGVLADAPLPERQSVSAEEAEGGAFWRQIDAQYCDEGQDLGVHWNAGDGEARFSLWAPSAATVAVQLFDPANGNKEVGGAPLVMTRAADTGVWSTQLSASDLELDTLIGLSYRFNVDGRPALDPYARAVVPTKDGLPLAVIIDRQSQRVPGYARIAGYQRPTDAVIYELSVRDFTSDPAIESTLRGAPFGTFKALQQRLDYLVALGVTHIQLMPVMAWYRSDPEASRTREDEWTPAENNYNWGYDPLGYFAPELSYATDPNDPQGAVDELRQLIAAIHARGMGVILDVVYNHHPVTEILDAIEPGYYYRGRNDSQAGADLASERCMVRKLMLDSLRYWAQDYRVDGFRFDLMGLIDARSIREAYQMLTQLNPKMLLLGEGWRMYKGPVLHMADQDWALAQNGVAMFSDDFRDLVKSGFGDEGQPRFVTGGRESITALLQNLRGEPLRSMRADDPGDVVQYVAAHDNLTLHDVIAVALSLDPDKPAAQREIQRRIRLANTLLLTAQGVAFIHSGQEYGRTRRWRGEEASPEATSNAVGVSFVHNAYDSPDIVNWFDWSAVDGSDPRARTVSHTAGLIALRRATEAFRLGSTQAVYRHVRPVVTPDIAGVDNAVAWESRNQDGSRLMVIVNADTQERLLRISEDTARAEVLVDSQRAGLVPLLNPVDVRLEKRAVRLAALTATVLRFPP